MCHKEDEPDQDITRAMVIAIGVGIGFATLLMVARKSYKSGQTDAVMHILNSETVVVLTKPRG